MENNLRNTILNMLISTLEKGVLSHYVLKDMLKDESFNIKDRAFIQRTYTGTLEQLVYLNHCINAVSSVPVNKMKPVIRNILRMSFYQMRFMDSIPVYTCIDEAVRLTKKRGMVRLAGFVNGILRNLDRTADSLVLPDYVKANVPEWIYTMIITQYGKEAAERFFDAIRKEDKGLTVRFNELRYQSDEIIRCLEEEGCSIHKLEDRSNCYTLFGYRELTGLKAFREGMIIMQDPSSVLAVKAAISYTDNPKLVLDVCAAPGGKSLYAAQCFPEASVIARDLTERKIDLIRDNIKRTGLMNITPQVYDALTFDGFMKEKADLVIADLPCSGLGVIRRKPDILYRLKPEDPKHLATLQKDILKNVQAYVKPGGILMYSTCTINRQENHDNKEWIIREFPFVLEGEKQSLPGTDPYDGFYYAIFRKR